MLKFLLARLREPSTYNALAMLVGGGALAFPSLAPAAHVVQAVADAAVGGVSAPALVAAGVAAGIGILLPENGGGAPPTGGVPVRLSNVPLLEPAQGPAVFGFSPS